MAPAFPDSEGPSPEADSESALPRTVSGHGRTRLVGALRIGTGLLVGALVVLFVVRRWGDVRATLDRISPAELLLAEALVLTGLVGNVLTWRVVARELGWVVHFGSAAKIYLLGQLAKYLPGSFWVFPAQMELARAARVPRVRVLASSLVALGFNVLAGLAIGLLVFPAVVEGGAWRAVTLVAAAVVGLAALSPPVVTRLLNVGLRLVRQPLLERGVTWRGTLAAAALSIATWVSYGTSLWVLAVAAGAPAAESFPLCLAGFALAMTAGLFVFAAPSGIGVREAVVVVVLAPVLDRPEALAVALAARFVFTLGDLLAAAAVTAVRIQPWAASED